MTTTVLLVDDHPVVRSGLRAVLDAAEKGNTDYSAKLSESVLSMRAKNSSSFKSSSIFLANWTS